MEIPSTFIPKISDLPNAPEIEEEAEFGFLPR
jgi:hypothetical protein